ncbi:hypothetical protein ABBQ32_013108 [Trebouxia sp. C0010 RCD-2024]
MALESHAIVCKQEQLHPQRPHSAGLLQVCGEQPPQQGSLQPLAFSDSTPAEGLLQQPSQQAGPHTLAVPLHHGSFPPPPSHGGCGVTHDVPRHLAIPPQPLFHQDGAMPLQACPGPVHAALKLTAVQSPGLLPASSALQQPEDEEVCCAQSALPSALPQQQQRQQQQQLLATRDTQASPPQGPALGISTLLPADRSSSSGRVSAKTDQAEHANKPAWQESMHRAPDADPPTRVQPQNAGQGRLRSGDTSIVPDKENAGTVNPKRILKSKARAAAEADREAKRSKALTSSQALAEAKAAALASGWDTDDDFETLPRR